MRKRKKIGILTGGGDVPPLNAVISAARRSAARSNVDLIGFVKGWEGVIEKRFVDLGRVEVDPQIGGTILKSSRVNLAAVPGVTQTISDNFRSIGLDGLIVVGGEDTLSNSFAIHEVPQVLISKTIDNDVGVIPQPAKRLNLGDILNYFTLGYPTAATHISGFVSLRYGLRSTAYSHERIMVVESMGMHAGWLALASSVGKPDFIIIPEFPLDYQSFREIVARRYAEQKNVVIVIAEGARWKDGSYVSADQNEKDGFGHPRFNGSAAALAQKLKLDLRGSFDTRNVNSVNPSYLYRSGTPGKLDLQFAGKLGVRAIQVLAGSPKESVFLTTRKSGTSFEVTDVPLKKFDNIEQLHRLVDSTLYSPGEYCVTDEGKRYLSHLVRQIPDVRYGLKD